MDVVVDGDDVVDDNDDDDDDDDDVTEFLTLYLLPLMLNNEDPVVQHDSVLTATYTI